MTLSTITFSGTSQSPKQQGLLSFPSTAAKTVTNHSVGTDALISAEPIKRDLAYRVWRTRTATALLDYGLGYEAFLFNECSERPSSWIKSKTEKLPKDAATVWLCSHDPSHDAALFMPTCDLRICPDCAARQAARFAARYIPVALELATKTPNKKLRHIVFTTKINLTSNTPEVIQKLVAHYSTLPRKALKMVEKQGKEHGRDYSTLGAIQSFEFGADGLLLHFHVIQYGSYVPKNLLRDAWKSLTNDEAYIVDVRIIDNNDPEKLKNAVVETLKYSVKFWSYDKKTGETKYLEPNIMPHLLRVLKGTRRVKSWGVFYNIPELEKEPLKCQECNHDMERLGCENWHYWIEQGATKADLNALKEADSFLALKLANKSKKSQLSDSKDPPDLVEKYRQKDLFKPQSLSHYFYEDNL